MSDAPAFQSASGLTLQAMRDPITCPMCGGLNAHDAVFCANPACHKALGEFKYVREELAEEAKWHETLAERVTGFIGKPHFLLLHIFWISIWVLANTGLFYFVRVREFDMYPFALLGILLAVETIFITGFLLISQNRQNAHAEKRAELDYEVNVRTYRHIHDIDARLFTVLERMDRLEAALRERKPEAVPGEIQQ